MTKTLLFSALLALFVIPSFRAQDDKSIALKAKSFLELLKEEHLQPADVSGHEYHDQVLYYLLYQLDSDNRLFTSEDESFFRKNLNLLSEDLKDNKIQFLKLVREKYELRFKEMKAFSEVYFAKAFKSDENVKIKPSKLDKRPNASDQKQNWASGFRKEIFDIALGSADSTQLNTDSLEILVQNSFREMSGIMTDYFAMEDELDYLFEDVYLNALAMAFDPHSSYFNVVQEKEFENELSGNRELFGFSLDKNAAGNFYVSNLVPGSAAWMSGEIETNDIVVEIRFDNKKPLRLASLSMTELERIFASSDARFITLTIEEADKSLSEVILEKTILQLDGDLVKSAILNGSQKVGYITLPDFYTSWENDINQLGCANDVAKAILKMKKENISGLILDLRGNGGGSLKEAVDLVGIFIDFGPVLITRSNSNELTVIKDFNRGMIFSAPLMILIDEGSASASEIVAAALQDHKRALIVGQKSFGKSTGQSILPLSLPELSATEQAYGKITMDGIYRIDLSTHQKSGVVPDVLLPPIYSEADYSESSYPNALELDSIEKKVYFEPLNLSDPIKLQFSSDARVAVDPNFLNIREIMAALEELLSEEREHTLTLDAMLTDYLKYLTLVDQIADWKEKVVVDYKVQNLAFDEDLYSDGSLLKQYNERFLRRLALDFELNESYRIMLDLINDK